MLNSELKATMRTLYREKSYAIINLMGLSLAIACCLVLGLYLRSELTYDRHHERYRQIFRVVNDFTTSSATDSLAYTSTALGPMLKKNYPEIQAYVRFRPAAEKLLIRSEDKAYYWDNAYIVDENVFDVFTHKIIYGDPKTALKDPSSAAVSETFARKYFGSANPIGKTINAEYDPQHPFEYSFLDESIAKLYLPEERLMKMTGIFSGICIFISCLGLFGLAAFTTEQRSKEIGIRKVLGASTSQIIVMLSRKTLLLVFASAIIASIAAYFALDEWLTSFAYRVGINPLVFFIATAIVMAVAFFTVALQSYKTAQANPARTLRYE
jgi:hypothetical protein